MISLGALGSLTLTFSTYISMRYPSGAAALGVIGCSSLQEMIPTPVPANRSSVVLFSSITSSTHVFSCLSSLFPLMTKSSCQARNSPAAPGARVNTMLEHVHPPGLVEASFVDATAWRLSVSGSVTSTLLVSMPGIENIQEPFHSRGRFGSPAVAVGSDASGAGAISVL